MSDIEKPSKLPRWASVLTNDPITGVPNRVDPPETKKNVGWLRGEPPARQWFNENQYYNYLWLRYFEDRVDNRNVVSDGNGEAVVSKENVLVTLYAIDSTNPDNYIHAIGFRGTSEPNFNIISNNVLDLGAALSDGTQPITGADPSDIILYINMQK